MASLVQLVRHTSRAVGDCLAICGSLPDSELGQIGQPEVTKTAAARPYKTGAGGQPRPIFTSARGLRRES
jgi:hypothetical protein